MLWPINEKNIDSQYLGQLSPERVLFEFDDQPSLWVADCGPSGVEKLFQVQEKSRIEQYLPIMGTMLFPKFDNKGSV